MPLSSPSTYAVKTSRDSGVCHAQAAISLSVIPGATRQDSCRWAQPTAGAKVHDTFSLEPTESSPLDSEKSQEETVVEGWSWMELCLFFFVVVSNHFHWFIFLVVPDLNQAFLCKISSAFFYVRYIQFLGYPGSSRFIVVRAKLSGKLILSHVFPALFLPHVI